jgi:hypothetical protein
MKREQTAAATAVVMKEVISKKIVFNADHLIYIYDTRKRKW